MSLAPITAEELKGLFVKTQAEIRQRNINDISAGIYRGVLHYAAAEPDTNSYRVRVFQHNYISKHTNELVEGFYVSYPMGDNLGVKTTTPIDIDAIADILAELRRLFIGCKVEFVTEVLSTDDTVIQDHILIAWDE